MASLRACLVRVPQRVAQALSPASAGAARMQGLCLRHGVASAGCLSTDGLGAVSNAVPVPIVASVARGTAGTRGSACGAGACAAAAPLRAYSTCTTHWDGCGLAVGCHALTSGTRRSLASCARRELHTDTTLHAARPPRRKAGADAAVKEAATFIDELRDGLAAEAFTEGGDAQRRVVAHVVALSTPLFRAGMYDTVLDLLDAMQPPDEPILGLASRLRSVLQGGGVGMDAASLAQALGFDDAWMAVPPRVAVALAGDGDISAGSDSEEGASDGSSLSSFSDDSDGAVFSDGHVAGSANAQEAAAIASDMVGRAFWGSSKLLTVFVFALDGTVRAQKKRARLFAAGPIRKHRRDASDALLMMRLASAAGVVPSPALSHATMRLAAATGNRAVALGVLGVQAHHSTRLSKDTAVEFMRTHMPQYTVDGQGALRHQPGKRTVDLFMSVLAPQPSACVRTSLRVLVEACARCNGYRIDDALSLFRKFVPGVPDARTRAWLAVAFLSLDDTEGVTAFWDDKLMSELLTPIEAVALFNAAAREPRTPARVDLMDRVWRGALQFTLQNPRTRQLTAPGHVLLSQLIKARLSNVAPGASVTSAQEGVDALMMYYPIPDVNGRRDKLGALQWERGMPSSSLLSDVVHACLACKDVERLVQVFDYAHAGAYISTPALVKAAHTLLTAHMPHEAAIACDVYMRQTESFNQPPAGVMVRLASQAYGALGRVPDVLKLATSVEDTGRANTPGLPALRMTVMCSLVQAHATRGDIDSAMDVFEAAVDAATESADTLIDTTVSAQHAADPAAFIAQRRLRPACEALVTALARSGDPHATIDFVEDAAHNMAYAPTPRAFRLMVDLCREHKSLMERVLALMLHTSFEPRGWVLSTMQSSLGPAANASIAQVVRAAREAQAASATQRKRARNGAGAVADSDDATGDDSDTDTGAHESGASDSDVDHDDGSDSNAAGSGADTDAGARVAVQ